MNTTLLARIALIKGLALAFACTAPHPDTSDRQAPPGDPGASTTFIEATPQQSGNAAAGYAFMANGNLIGCGMPKSLFDIAVGPADAATRLPGRNALNADVSYAWTLFTTTRGNVVAHPNCFSCHADFLRGELIVGLGAYTSDFTTDATSQASLARAILQDENDLAEFDYWMEHATAVAPYILTDTVGVNPADVLGPALASHRDPATLAWQSTPVFDVPLRAPPPMDVPPLWRVKYKNALYATAAGRGDHTRLMMQASTMCVDTVAEANEIAAHFADVRAYLMSLAAPAWPYALAPDLVEQGRSVFAQTCARCHGTNESDYPNLLVALDEVGTDPQFAKLATGEDNEAYLDWFAQSFYGEGASLEPADGYVAPPLEGIWATAPFFHNGSVPTLDGVIDETLRPTRFRLISNRGDFGYDAARGGWHYDEVPSKGSDVTVYDTTRAGYNNTGHRYGSALNSDDKTALLEYLKSL